jgi:hypothetical protein
VWRPGVSKVQYRMIPIDAAGSQIGNRVPAISADRQYRKAPTNIFAYDGVRDSPRVGQRVFPEFVRNAFVMAPATIRESDAVLLTLAPIMGDILTIRRPLARYRIHGANTMALASLEADKLRKQLHQDAKVALLFATASQRLQLSVVDNPLSHSLNHLQYRYASRLVDPSAHPFPGDTVIGLSCRLICAAVTCSQMRLRHRAVLLVWVIDCALTPPYYRRNLILWRFSPISRPAAVRTLPGVLSSLRSTRLLDRT